MSRGECLKYGQIVSISPLENQRLCIYSDGLIKTEAQLVEVNPDTLASGSLYYQSLFRIYPSFVTSRLHQALHFETKQDDGSKKMQKIKDLQQKIIVEYKVNIETIQKLKDKPIPFNSAIQFLHYPTNRFLSMADMEARFEKENFMLALTEFSSSRTTFLLQAAFQHQQASDALIFPGDSVYIACHHNYQGMKPKLRATLSMRKMKNSEYIMDRSLYAVPNVKLLKKLADQILPSNEGGETNVNFQKIQRAAQMIKESSVPLRRQTTAQVPMEVKQEGEISEVNVSLEKQSPWVLSVFGNQNDLEQIITYNDIIWIHHIEENSLVSLGRNQDNELIITFAAVNPSGEFEGDSNGMFQIENENMMMGGLVEWGQNVRLRHFILGKYLAINMEPIKGGQMLLYLADTPASNTLFQFVPVPTMGSNQISQRYVTKDSFMKLKTGGKKTLWAHIETKKVLQQNSRYRETVTEEDKVVLVVRLTEQSEDEDVLKLYKANYSDVIEANFLTTCFPVLRKSLTELKNVKDINKEEEKQKVLKTLGYLAQTISKLEKFCNNTLINTQLDVKNAKVAVLQRQKILREQYFIDMLIEIMKYITNEEELKVYHEYEVQMHKASLEKDNNDKRQKELIPTQKRGHTQNRSRNHDSTSPVRTTSQIQSNHGIHSIKNLQPTRSQHHHHTHAHTSHRQRMYLKFLQEKMNVLKIIYRLLRSICQDNQENQSYLYKLFPQFIYQIKYFKEATDCIITVLNGNDQILVNLCDQIKLNEKVKAREVQQDSDESHVSDEVEVKFHSSVDDKKSILLYYKSLTEDSKGQRNIQYLQFFRCICRLNGDSISVNQEMIFKFMKQNEVFKQALFMPIIIEDKKMKIFVDETQISYLASIKDPLIKDYLIEQLFLYADLAYQRNFLWKSYLERIFPTRFIFEQIFDNQIFEREPHLAIKYRSAFCNIALTVYVDHEPFNQALVPNLCRLYTETKPIKKSLQSSEKLRRLANEFTSLVDCTFKYLDELCSSIDKDLEKKYKTKVRAQQLDDESVTNELVLDIVRLISIMIRFDMLKIMNKQQNYRIIVPKLIKLLEYDKKNLLYPFILHTVRQNNIEKAKESTLGLGGIKNLATGAAAFINNVAKALSGSILGIPPKQQESLEDEFSEYDTTVIARNPIIGSLITISSMLDQMATTGDQKVTQVSSFESEIQKEVCGILLYFQDQRQDFYVTNFIAFYKQFTTKYQVLNLDNPEQKAKFFKDLESELVQTLPPFLKTGIEQIDKWVQDQIDGLYKQDMNELMAVGGLLNQSKKFTKLIPDLQEMPDLDKLMAGENAELMEAQILPSILISFYITTDFSLQNKLVELMRRAYGQTYEMFYHLQRVELLFQEEEIRCYQFIETSIQDLKIITECSEVWLVDFLALPNGDQTQINRILRLLADITLLLQEGTYIDHKGRVMQKGNEGSSFRITTSISGSRQKIFNFLNAYQPIVNFIRDTQQQLVKVLDDEFYTIQTKDATVHLLKALFLCLRDFCQSNDENQAIMHQHSSLFLDELQHNFGQMELLSAIYKDNKTLCQKINDGLLRKILSFIYSFGRQARFLNLYKSIQTYKNNPITEVQQRVLHLFIPQHIGIEEYVDINEFYLYGNFTLRDGHKSLEFIFERSREGKLLDQPYLYHSEMLQVLLQTIVGEESFKVNSPKLKKLFSLHYLMELLLQEDDMLDEEAGLIEGIESILLDQRSGIKYIKPQLIEMINLLYVNNKVTDLFLFIKEQSTFTHFFESEKLRLVKAQVLNLPFERYYQYFFDSVIVLMRYYSEKLIVKDANQEYKERADYQELKDIMNIIHGMCNTHIQNKLQAPQYNNLVKFVYSLDDQMFRINAGAFSMALEQKEIIKPVQAEAGEETIFTRKNPLHSPLNEKPQLKRTENKTDVDLLMQDHSIDWNCKAKWQEFLEMCQQLTNVKKTQLIEMRMLTMSFLDAQKFIPELIIKELGLTIKFKDFLKKLIRFVEIGIINKADKINLMFALQLLEDILDSKDDLETMQNLFDECQGTRMFLNLLADFQVYPFDDDLLQQLFKYALKLTKNGNQRIQSTVYNYFSNFEKSELIFLKMYQIIYEVINDNKSRQQYLEQQQIQQDKDQQQQQLFLSNVKEIHQEDPQSTKEYNENRQNKLQTLIYLLKYFQLICEGHNLKIQDYLRQQVNSRNNYNIVQAMVELLCAFETDLQKDAFEVVMNTLETLTELVQGPCSQNQQDIIDSQFLEVASNYLNMHIESKKKKSKTKTADVGGGKEDASRERSNSLQSKSTARAAMKRKTPQIDRWMLERLKYKCMVLVSSLLELNSDNTAIKRILRSLPIHVLRNNLITIFKKHEKMYKKIGYNKDSLGHLNEDPHDTKYPPEYHELIVETGFLIYFLINHYANLDTKEIDPQTRDELEEIKESQKESEKADPWAQLQSTLFGQLASLVFSLVGGILEMINEWREEIQRQVLLRLKVSNDSEEQEKMRAQKKLAYQRAFSDSIKFFAKNSATIEVIRNGRIEEIIFYKLSFCNYLPKENKTEFHENVDRDSTNSKVSALVESTQNIIDVCKHEEDLNQLFNQNKFIALFAKYVILWKDLSFLLTLILNVFVILSYYEGDSEDPDERFRVRIYEPTFLKVLPVAETKSIFTYCGIGMIICSTFVVLFFILKKGPLYIKEAWNSSKDMLKEDQNAAIRFFIKIYMIGFCFIKVLLNIDLVYYLAYGALAFVATLVHPFIFAFHLSEVVLRYPTLRNIIKSFWEPKVALGLTFVLVMLMNYYFTIIAYIWFSDIYANDKCGSLLVCFLSTFDYAFKNNGGIGGWFDGSFNQNPDSYNYGRFFFDNLNNILIQMISIQIFSGIIIDTFGELREQQLNKNDDKDNICFICGLDREIFDMKQDDGFTKHIKHSHYMWNYVYYMSYLDYKSKSEFNGIETYIYNKLKSQDNSWFPIGQALELQEELEDQEAMENKRMSMLQQKVSIHITQKYESIRQLAERVNQVLSDLDELKNKQA